MAEERPVPVAVPGKLINTPWGSRVIAAVLWLKLSGQYQWAYMMDGLDYGGRQVVD